MKDGRSSLNMAIGILLILCSSQLYGEERNLRALMNWKAAGSIHSISTHQMLFLGVMEGILYVETEKGDMDGAFFECPVSQKINPESGESTAKGHCQITVGPEDVVYAEFDCDGKIGDCTGQFRLVEGSGRFEGVSGGSDIRIRSILGVLMKGMASGSLIRSGEGIALLPNLKVIVP
jgi:hypothetical protein